jgi:hypothetical protein
MRSSSSMRQQREGSAVEYPGPGGAHNNHYPRSCGAHKKQYPQSYGAHKKHSHDRAGYTKKIVKNMEKQTSPVSGPGHRGCYYGALANARAGPAFAADFLTALITLSTV